MNLAIDVSALRKTFHRRTRAPGLAGLARSLFAGPVESFVAVEGLDLRVAPGESLALIGPNGAGKSTTIKMLTGILFPSGGEARVLGLVPWRERARLAMNVATVFGQRSQLWHDLPAGESFDLLASIYELPRGEYLARRAALVDRFELGPLLSISVRKLSLGQRMRCELAASLLHRPQVLFLDEPTVGLDVIAKREVRALVRELNRDEGVTVLLTSHDAGDVEQLCERVLIVNHGRAVFDDKVSALRQRYLRRKVIVLRLEAPAAELPALEGVSIVEASPLGLKLEVDTERQPVAGVIAALVSSLRVADVSTEDPGLEEIIAAIYRDRAPPARREAS